MTTAMQRKRMLRALAPVATADPVVDPLLRDRAAVVYPDTLEATGFVRRDAIRAKWIAAVCWMRRNGNGPGSVWVMDRGARAPGWKAVDAE